MCQITRELFLVIWLESYIGRQKVSCRWNLTIKSLTYGKGTRCTLGLWEKLVKFSGVLYFFAFLAFTIYNNQKRKETRLWNHKKFITPNSPSLKHTLLTHNTSHHWRRQRQALLDVSLYHIGAIPFRDRSFLVSLSKWNQHKFPPSSRP